MLLRAAIIALVGAIALASAPLAVHSEKLAVHAENKDAAAPPPMVGANGAPAPAAIPDDHKLSMLIRTTLIALSQANQTGNYSVLRDLATPRFQMMNSDAQLTQIFSGLRGRNLDFSPVLFFEPKLIRPPSFEGSILRLTGYIPTEPQRILFDMGFEWFGADWRLSAIVIDVQPTPSPTPARQPDKDTDAKTKHNLKANKSH